MFKASVQDARLILSRPYGYRFRAMFVIGVDEERLTLVLLVDLVKRGSHAGCDWAKPKACQRSHQHQCDVQATTFDGEIIKRVDEQHTWVQLVGRAVENYRLLPQIYTVRKHFPSG